MKKVITLFIIIITIMIGIISYICLRYKNLELAKEENLPYESYKGQEIFGTDLATLINKAIDSNEKNKVKKDENKYYIDNKENSIAIDIKFIDDDETHKMEELVNGKISTFVGLYNQIKFRCTDIKYHTSTNKVKYMVFEQITD